MKETEITRKEYDLKQYRKDLIKAFWVGTLIFGLVFLFLVNLK